ncbi:MAG: hypothetical protein LBP65_00150 [Puniceicoccales bacterium]|jgi:hypothetical protein|nr:hypothetical protein [Puniceicoccales bacterium]
MGNDFNIAEKRVIIRKVYEDHIDLDIGGIMASVWPPTSPAALNGYGTPMAYLTTVDFEKGNWEKLVSVKKGVDDGSVVNVYNGFTSDPRIVTLARYALLYRFSELSPGEFHLKKADPDLLDDKVENSEPELETN